MPLDSYTTSSAFQLFNGPLFRGTTLAFEKHQYLEVLALMSADEEALSLLIRDMMQTVHSLRALRRLEFHLQKSRERSALLDYLVDRHGIERLDPGAGSARLQRIFDQAATVFLERGMVDSRTHDLMLVGICHRFEMDTLVQARRILVWAKEDNHHFDTVILGSLFQLGQGYVSRMVKEGGHTNKDIRPQLAGEGRL